MWAFMFKVALYLCTLRLILRRPSVTDEANPDWALERSTYNRTVCILVVIQTILLAMKFYLNYQNKILGEDIKRYEARTAIHDKKVKRRNEKLVGRKKRYLKY